MEMAIHPNQNLYIYMIQKSRSAHINEKAILLGLWSPNKGGTLTCPMLIRENTIEKWDRCAPLLFSGSGTWTDRALYIK